MSMNYLYVDTLQDALKNVSTILITLHFQKVSHIVSLFFRHVFNVSQKYASITYTEAN
jgi:hypothetical protein